MYDYGQAENLKKYGTLKPTEYEIERITNRYVAILHAKQDMFVNERDLNNIRSRLKGRITERLRSTITSNKPLVAVPLFDDFLVKNVQYNHLDFTIGRRAGYYVYTRCLEILRRCELGLLPPSPAATLR